MKRRMHIVCSGFLVLSLLFSCDKEKINPGITGELVKNSECKTFKSAFIAADVPDNRSCVDWTYDHYWEKLSLKHINAGFNCCPGKLSCDVSLRDDTLVIEESEKNSLCRCNCLFDLEIEITNVTSGKYHVRFIEPYCGNQEKIIFDMDLTDQPSGTFCVTRKQYP